MSAYVEPSLGSTRFSCPHCKAFAHQAWFRVYLDLLDPLDNPTFPERSDLNNPDAHTVDARRYSRAMSVRSGDPAELNVIASNLHLNRCIACRGLSIWVADALVSPSLTSAPLVPNPDFPDEAQLYFEEAAKIVDASPRAAAAWLRVCVHKLIVAVGGSGRNLTLDLAALSRRGLDPRIPRALEVVRMTGPNAVPPGQLDQDDVRATAMRLFQVANLIANSLITQPKLMDSIFENAELLKLGSLK